MSLGVATLVSPSLPSTRVRHSQCIKPTVSTRRGLRVFCVSVGAKPDQKIDQARATLYDLLGVPRDVTSEQIKSTYRQLARRYHPDVQRHDGLSLEESTKRFIEVQEAYEVLSDPQRRAMYDFEMLHPTSSLKRGRSRGWRKQSKYPWRNEMGWETPEEEVRISCVCALLFRNRVRFADSSFDFSFARVPR